MCLLMVTLGEIPSIDYLYNASENNPDGFGFAVNHGDRIVTGRSMKHERLIERFIDEMKKSHNPVGMFHSRYTTHGTTTLENNHPFRVDGRKDTVLAHNGMLPITPRAGDNRSDTRIFAEDILGSIGLEQLDTRTGFDNLENFIGASKVAILTNAPELRDSVYILNEHMGDWEGDIWWSNSTYKWSYNSYDKGYKYGGYYSTDTQAWSDEIGGGNWWNDPNDEYVKLSSVSNETWSCMTCLHEVTIEEIKEGMCDVCSSCLDCASHVAECLCYTPATAQKFNQIEKFI